MSSRVAIDVNPTRVLTCVVCGMCLSCRFYVIYPHLLNEQIGTEKKKNTLGRNQKIAPKKQSKDITNVLRKYFYSTLGDINSSLSLVFVFGYMINEHGYH